MARRRPRVRSRRDQEIKTGLPPGAPVYVGPPRDSRVRVHAIDYDRDAVRELHDPPSDRLKVLHSARSVTWIDCDGVHDTTVVQELGEVFSLHPLWIEDILNPSTRPKVDVQAGQLLVILRVLDSRSEVTSSEQVAIVLGDGFVLSFQEHPGDGWDIVRRRIRDGAGRIRTMGADYLLHALVDVVVDEYFRCVQKVEDAVDRLEDDALERPSRRLSERILSLKSELGQLRSAAGPVREAISLLVDGDLGCVRPETLPFFRDLSDHLAQVVDAVEQDRERLLGAIELQLAMSNQRLNETMRFLTVVSTIFLPLMFMSSIWGMNFDGMWELHEPWGYPAALASMAGVGGSMYLWFRSRDWL